MLWPQSSKVWVHLSHCHYNLWAGQKIFCDLYVTLTISRKTRLQRIWHLSLKWPPHCLQQIRLNIKISSLTFRVASPCNKLFWNTRAWDSHQKNTQYSLRTGWILWRWWSWVKIQLAALRHMPELTELNFVHLPLPSISIYTCQLGFWLVSATHNTIPIYTGNFSAE